VFVIILSGQDLGLFKTEKPLGSSGFNTQKIEIFFWMGMKHAA
jgi:hypothetical protein